MGIILRKREGESTVTGDNEPRTCKAISFPSLGGGRGKETGGSRARFLESKRGTWYLSGHPGQDLLNHALTWFSK